MRCSIRLDLIDTLLGSDYRSMVVIGRIDREFPQALAMLSRFFVPLFLLLGASVDGQFPLSEGLLEGASRFRPPIEVCKWDSRRRRRPQPGFGTVASITASEAHPPHSQDVVVQKVQKISSFFQTPGIVSGSFRYWCCTPRRRRRAGLGRRP